MSGPYRSSGEEPHAGSNAVWMDLLQRGPIGLLRYDFRDVERLLPDVGKVIFRKLLDDMERQSKWIVERTAAMRDEAERIALIGQTMKRAGLRSYTDEKGRIFVAGDP